MKKFLLAAACMLLVACKPTVLPPRKTADNPDPNHTHANFLVVIDGHALGFSDKKYMSGVSYDEESHNEPEEYHHQYFHLHDGNGDVMHSHKPGQSIGEFFASVGFTMTDTCFSVDTGEEYCDEWRMFVNGEETAFDPGYVFQDIDRILLIYGSSSDEELQSFMLAVPDDACLYSRTCPERGDPPAENCIADPSVPCVAPLDDFEDLK